MISNSQYKGGEKMANRKDFIGFIIRLDKDQQLVDEFNKIRTSAKLYEFFQGHGYNDIIETDCKDILTLRRKMRGRRVPKAKQTARATCVPGGKVY
jgi:hypothetical protein